MNAQVASFLAKYTPELAAELLQARECLAGLVPRGFELVYDNYSALVFGFSPTERARDAVLPVAGYPKWVTLFFLKGAALRDPDALLKGSGSTVRSIRLSSAATLQTAAVRALIARRLQRTRRLSGPHHPAEPWSSRFPSSSGRAARQRLLPGPANRGRL